MSAVPKSGTLNHLASHRVSQSAVPINNGKDVKHGPSISSCSADAPG